MVWKMLICEISFWKPFQWRGREWGMKERDAKGETGKSQIQWGEGGKARGKRRETRRGFAYSNLQRRFRQSGSLLSMYFYKASRNTSSAIHFISIPTPASHLHSVSFTSPFHFSACHYISWMITYCQFLHWHSMGQDKTPPASKARGWEGSLFPVMSRFVPPLWVPVLLSCFHQ